MERCGQRSRTKRPYILRKNVNINSKYFDAVINWLSNNSVKVSAYIYSLNFVNENE